MATEVTIGGAIFAGALSFLSPCVLPLVPPYLAYLAGVGFSQFTGTDDNAPRPTRRIALTAFSFVLGFSTVFVLLGATASALGRSLAAYLPILTPLAGVSILIFGLHFLGVFRIKLFYREARVHVSKKPAGYMGAYAMGLAFAFGWTPCVGPVLAAILFVAGSEDSAAQGAGLLAAYSAGLGIPFLLAALFAGQFVRLSRRLRSGFAYIEKAMGVLLVLTGVLFLSGRMGDISIWLIETFPVLSRIG